MAMQGQGRVGGGSNWIKAFLWSLNYLRFVWKLGWAKQSLRDLTRGIDIKGLNQMKNQGLT